MRRSRMDAQCCKHWRHHLKPPLKALRIAPFFPRPARLCDGGKTRITHFAHVRKGFDIFCPNRCFHTQNVFLINWPDFLERRAVMVRFPQRGHRIGVVTIVMIKIGYDEFAATICPARAFPCFYPSTSAPRQRGQGCRHAGIRSRQQPPSPGRPTRI